MGTFVDMTDQVCGCLRVIRCAGRGSHGVVLWECECDISLGGCGSLTVVRGIHLRSGHTTSCGCVGRAKIKTASVTHGKTHTPEYHSWYGMKARCTNPKNKSFPRYGGRGVLVCDRWLHSFENFFADMGLKPSAKHTLERVDNNADYGPDNCVWATRTTQCRNTRRNRMFTKDGQTKCMSEWAHDLGLMPATIHKRLARGWSIERALSQ